jgi:hypothetical protein
VNAKKQLTVWALLCMGFVLFTAAGFLLWLDLPDWSAALAAGCAVSAAFAFIMAGFEYVFRD